MAMAVDPWFGASESGFPARLAGLARPDHLVRGGAIAQA
jgi:hypothetical protein